ncbi:DUF2178 domain-containing protein [uncultured Methanomethylovorans sp.]|uniref:DUF2178 domain-containing protein n=1 Tax=uncultured Methanomethylovorans sp. TaxID=183759 RepID=UPI002AA6EB84|nr:DUF2178 domain-containing protein [uncultured Methanomethylovorans sp.]
MKKEQFRVISLVTVVSVGAIIGFASSIGNPILAGGGMFAGMAVLYLAKRTVKGVVEDEMNFHINHLASALTLKLVTICFATVGAILIAMRNTYPQYMDLGFFLAYTSCIIIMLYAIFYSYYNRKYEA